MNITQINTAILQGGWSNDQLTSMIDAVKFARARLTEQSKRNLSIGDNVNFTSSKTGQNVTGVVTKIAIKYVTVKTVAGAWRVPANMLSKIDEAEFV
jgi:hypothetical protein